MIRSKVPAAECRRTLRIIAYAAVLVGLLLSLYPLSAKAGQEGVFVNESVYFTLRDAGVSVGLDSQTVRFQLRLNNDSSEFVDYNQFSVRVQAPDGTSYAAQLSQRGEGVVIPNTAESYSYASKLPASYSPDELKIGLYDRSDGSAYLLGELSVANSPNWSVSSRQLFFNLTDADTSATVKDANISINAQRGIVVPENGKWTVVLDATAELSGEGSVVLPTELKFMLRDGAGGKYPLTMNAVEGTTIRQGKANHLLLSTTTDSKPVIDDLRLELIKNDASETLIGKLSVASVFTVAKIREAVPYTIRKQSGVTIELSGTQLMERSGDRQLLATVIIGNNSANTLALPALSGAFLSAGNELSIPASAVIIPEPYVAAGAAAVYRFAADIPDGVDASALQLLLSELVAQKSDASAGTGSSATTVTGIPVLLASMEGITPEPSGALAATKYELGERIAFDPASRLIDSGLDVSIVELNAHTNAENGYQTVVAKFKFHNKSNETLAIPALATELTDTLGVSYPGAKQTTALQQLIPNAGYVYTYSYLLPPSDNETYTMHILDTMATTAFKIPIASYQVQVAHSGTETPTMPKRDISFYPFSVKIEDWILSQQYSGNSYTYKLKLFLDVKQTDSVIVDNTFSVVEFEVTDSRGRILGSTSMPFLGAGKLISGEQTIDFTNIKSAQFEYPVTVKMYETIQTASGSAKRLVATFTQ